MKIADKEIRVVKGLPTLARISSVNSRIEVSEKFKTLDNLSQELVITQLKIYKEINNIFLADTKAIEELIIKHPEIKKYEWISKMEMLLSSFAPTELNKKRIEKLLS
jgi:hypothetical protein